MIGNPPPATVEMIYPEDWHDAGSTPAITPRRPAVIHRLKQRPLIFNPSG